MLYSTKVCSELRTDHLIDGLTICLCVSQFLFSNDCLFSEGIFDSSFEGVFDCHANCFFHFSLRVCSWYTRFCNGC